MPPVHLVCFQNLLQVANQLLRAQYGEELQQKVPSSAVETSHSSGSRASPPPPLPAVPAAPLRVPVNSKGSPFKEKVFRPRDKSSLWAPRGLDGSPGTTCHQQERVTHPAVQTGEQGVGLCEAPLSLHPNSIRNFTQE